MFTLKEYRAAKSLPEAYELLNQSKNNIILGGLLWLKMRNKNYNIGIDLSQLGLNEIIEKETTIEIGCMTTLRQIETSSVINSYFNGILGESIKHIVGVQFRNSATIGGSIYSRFGFSDILTALLSLDSYVELYKEGIISLNEFIAMPYKKDILVKIMIKKDGSKGSYQSHRITATDLPVLAVSVSRCEDNWKIAIGGRPNKATLAIEAAAKLSQNPSQEQIKDTCEHVINEVVFGTNLRGSSQYRKELVKVLVKRGVEQLCK